MQYAEMFNPLRRMDFPTVIICVSPHSFLGTPGVILDVFFFIFSMNFLQANRIAPDGTPRFAASHLGLFCLLMSHKKDARLKRVNRRKRGGSNMYSQAMF